MNRPSTQSEVFKKCISTSFCVIDGLEAEKANIVVFQDQRGMSLAIYFACLGSAISGILVNKSLIISKVILIFIIFILRYYISIFFCLMFIISN